MKNIARLLTILFIIGRFRLDLLLNKKKIPNKYRILLWPFALFKQAQAKRGERLRYALEALGPIFIKFGQILSTRPDLFPEDIISELSQLQDQVTPFNNQVYKNIVEDALGQSVEELFESFSNEPLASASIAQVHAAKLKDGTEVVIKAVRPGIDKTIERDVALLELIARVVENFLPSTRRLKPIEIVDNYRETILDELDLAKEAANASQLRRNFLHSDKLYIPDGYWDRCRENVRVMERIYGIPVSDTDALLAQSTDMKKLAERGVDIFFTQVFDHNFFHADMHPGNVFVSHTTPEKPSYIAVDMAIVGSLTREDQYYLARNLLAMFRRDYKQVAELHIQSGWVPKATSSSSFESAIRAVCEPIFEKPLKDISFGQALITLFKTAQRFDMPVQPQLVLLQKTLVNIEGLGRQIYPELDLWETAHPFLERWVKNRYHPLSLLKDLRYNAPEWMERLPEVPQLILDSMKGQQDIASNIAQLNTSLDHIHTQKLQNQGRRRKLAIVILVAALANLAFTQHGIHLNAELLLLLATVASGLMFL